MNYFFNLLSRYSISFAFEFVFKEDVFFSLLSELLFIIGHLINESLQMKAAELACMMHLWLVSHTYISEQPRKPKPAVFDGGQKNRCSR
jgi:hypothetical protein